MLCFGRLTIAVAGLQRFGDQVPGGRLRMRITGCQLQGLVADAAGLFIVAGGFMDLASSIHSSGLSGSMRSARSRVLMANCGSAAAWRWACATSAVAAGPR